LIDILNTWHPAQATVFGYPAVPSYSSVILHTYFFGALLNSKEVCIDISVCSLGYILGLNGKRCVAVRSYLWIQL